MNRRTTRTHSRKGFALAHALTAACMVAWAGAALRPPVQPETSIVEPAGGDVQPEPGRESEAEGVREAVVTLTSGRELIGVLVSRTDESVVLRINGIDTTLPRQRVAGIRELAPVAERYRALRQTVDDNDVRARLALVEWLRSREAYRLALAELQGILEVDPGNPDARTLHTWLTNHLELASRSKERQSGRRTRPTPATPDVPLLTDEQINRIRVLEIDLSAPTRVIVPDDVMQDLMVRFPETFPASVDERESVLKAEPMEKLRMIFDRKARDLYDRVQVLEDPPAMATFKSRIMGGNGWLQNACASNRCHGGAEAGALRLLGHRANSDKIAYTNFIILDRFRLADGTPLINYDEPARSPLLHMALPRRASLYPHPEVDRQQLGQDWRFVFRTSNERGYRDTVNWITSMYRPRPDYEIEYPQAQPDDSEQPDMPADGGESGSNTGDVPTTPSEPPPQEPDPGSSP